MKNWFKSNRGFIVFLLGLGVFRLAVADWNPIPSGSMRPTLLEGDVVLVNRLAYNLKLPMSDTVLLELGTPRRGDVVTFNSPQDGVRLIKRLMAVPGDTVAMRDDVLYINGVAAQYDDQTPVTEPLEIGGSTPAIQATERVAGIRHRLQVLPEVPARRDFGPITVPPDQYFFLGDNRDNSADSRYIGLVPRRMLIGRAHHILVSADILGNWLPRWDRTVSRIE